MVSWAGLCPPGLRTGFLTRVLPGPLRPRRRPHPGCGGRTAGRGWGGCGLLLRAQPCRALARDGGLKREKVKDTFKEEQQKLYSKMIVGNHEDRSRS